MTPALLISMSTGVRSASRPSANAADRRQVGQVDAPHLDLRGRLRGEDLVARGSPFSTVRTASTTRAPAAARRSAASRPVPLLAPVTTASRPVWSGTCVHWCSSSHKRPSVSYHNIRDHRSDNKGPAVCTMTVTSTFQRARSEEQRADPAAGDPGHRRGDARRDARGRREPQRAQPPGRAWPSRTCCATSSPARRCCSNCSTTAWREWLDALGVCAAIGRPCRPRRRARRADRRAARPDARRPSDAVRAGQRVRHGPGAQRLGRGRQAVQARRVRRHGRARDAASGASSPSWTRRRRSGSPPPPCWSRARCGPTAGPRLPCWPRTRPTRRWPRCASTSATPCATCSRR